MNLFQEELIALLFNLNLSTEDATPYDADTS